MEKLVIHLLLHDSLNNGKTGYFLGFLSDFSTCALARFFFGPFSNTLVDSHKGKLLDGVPMKLSLDTSAGPWLMSGLRSGWTDVSTGKIDWLMGLGSKSKYDVSAGKLRCQFHFPARIVDTDLFHFHSSLNHFQQTSEKRKQST